MVNKLTPSPCFVVGKIWSANLLASEDNGKHEWSKEIPIVTPPSKMPVFFTLFYYIYCVHTICAMYLFLCSCIHT